MLVDDDYYDDTTPPIEIDDSDSATSAASLTRFPRHHQSRAPSVDIALTSESDVEARSASRRSDQLLIAFAQILEVRKPTVLLKKRKARRTPSPELSSPPPAAKKRRSKQQPSDDEDDEDQPIGASLFIIHTSSSYACLSDMELSVPRVKPGGDVASHSITISSDAAFTDILPRIFAAMQLNQIKLKPDLAARIPGQKKADNPHSLENEDEWSMLSRRVVSAYKVLCRGNGIKARNARGSPPVVAIEVTSQVRPFLRPLTEADAYRQYLASWKHTLAQQTRTSGGKGVKQLLDLNAAGNTLSVDPNGLAVSQSHEYYSELMHKKYACECGHHLLCIKIMGKYVAISAPLMSTWIAWLVRCICGVMQH